MVRVRHYTSVSAMRKILEQQRIIARDQGCVFIELARQRKLSPADAVETYRLRKGRGNAYVEFDVAADEVFAQPNALIKREESFLVGDVDLSERNAEGFYNI